MMSVRAVRSWSCAVACAFFASAPGDLYAFWPPPTPGEPGPTAPTAGDIHLSDTSTSETAWLMSDKVGLAPGVDSLTLQAHVRTGRSGQFFVMGLAFYNADGAWLSGANVDIEAYGDITPMPWRVRCFAVPPEASAVAVVVGPAAASPEDTGDVWLADVQLEPSAGPHASQGRRISLPPGAGDAVVWLDWPEQALTPGLPPPVAFADDDVNQPHHLTCLAGETESFQVGLRGSAAVVAAEIALQGGPPSTAGDVGCTLRSTTTVWVEHPSDAASAPGHRPDALEPVALPLALAPGITRGLWLDVKTERTAAPGRHERTLVLTFEGGATATIPFEVTVAPIALPVRPALPFVVGLPPQHVARYHGVEDDPAGRRAVLTRYLEAFASARIGALDAAEEAPMAVIAPAWGWTGGVAMAETGNRLLALRTPAKSDGEARARTTVPILVPSKQSVRVAWRARTLEGPGSWRLRLQWRDEVGMPTGESSWEPGSEPTWQPGERLVAPSDIPAGTTGVAIFADALSGAVALDDVSLVAGGDSPLERAPNSGFDASPLDGPLEFHTEEFDAWASLALDTLQMPLLRVWVQGGAHGHGGTYIPGNLMGFPEGTPEYEILLGEVTERISSHLAARGWLDRAYLYPFDEPTGSMMEPVGSALAMLGVHLPSIPRLLTHEPAAPLEGHVDVWMPVWSALQPSAVAQRQSHGDQVGSYVSCCLAPWVPNLFVDREPMQARALPLLAWSLGLDAVLYWSAVHWDSQLSGPPTQDPYTDPRTVLTTMEVVGNGDGRLLYPPRHPTAEAGPVPTQRWSLLRESLEDVDRLSLVEAAGGTVGAAPQRRHVPLHVAAGTGWHTEDFAALHAWRRAVVNWLTAHEATLAPPGPDAEGSGSSSDGSSPQASPSASGSAPSASNSHAALGAASGCATPHSDSPALAAWLVGGLTLACWGARLRHRR